MLQKFLSVFILKNNYILDPPDVILLTSNENYHSFLLFFLSVRTPEMCKAAGLTIAFLSISLSVPAGVSSCGQFQYGCKIVASVSNQTV